jgi:hypothetical protein
MKARLIIWSLCGALLVLVMFPVIGPYVLQGWSIETQRFDITDTEVLMVQIPMVGGPGVSYSVTLLDNGKRSASDVVVSYMSRSERFALVYSSNSQQVALVEVERGHASRFKN